MRKHQTDLIKGIVKTTPLTTKQILEKTQERSSKPITYSYTQQVLKNLTKEGVLKMVEVNGVRCYIRTTTTKSKPQPIETDEVWLKELAVAQPIVRKWEPYIPPKNVPNRPGSDEHIQWKSLSTPQS